MIKKYNKFVESKEDKQDLLDFIDGKDDIDVKEKEYDTPVNYKIKKDNIYDFSKLEDAIEDENKTKTLSILKQMKLEFPNIVHDEKYIELLKKITIL